MKAGRRGKAWWKSTAFWLGVPGLLFLLWSWIALIRRDVGMSWSTERSVWVVGSCDGSVAVLHRSNRSHGLHLRQGYEQWSEPYLEPGEQAMPFARPFHWHSGSPDSADAETGIGVAWWLLVTGYSLAWIATLGAWQRIRHREPVAGHGAGP